MDKVGLEVWRVAMVDAMHFVKMCLRQYDIWSHEISGVVLFNDEIMPNMKEASKLRDGINSTASHFVKEMVEDFKE